MSQRKINDDSRLSYALEYLCSDLELLKSSLIDLLEFFYSCECAKDIDLKHFSILVQEVYCMSSQLINRKKK